MCLCREVMIIGRGLLIQTMFVTGCNCGVIGGFRHQIPSENPTCKVPKTVDTLGNVDGNLTLCLIKVTTRYGK